MALAIGVDITDVNRMRQKIAAGEEFRDFVFTQQEIEFCLTHPEQEYELYSSFFAAKEALLKAISIGLLGGISLNQISVCKNESEEWGFLFGAEAQNFIDHHRITNIRLSISTAGNISTATVILEKNHHGV